MRIDICYRTNRYNPLLISSGLGIIPTTSDASLPEIDVGLVVYIGSRCHSV